jgi:hypothetical protein
MRKRGRLDNKSDSEDDNGPQAEVKLSPPAAVPLKLSKASSDSANNDIYMTLQYVGTSNGHDPINRSRWLSYANI